MEGDNSMNELLRITCRTNGAGFILPPQRDFVFFQDRLEIYKKGNLVRTINYSEVIEVSNAKTWQNNLFINCKPLGVMLYKISDDEVNKIKEIIGK